jgi:hypothetical protein
VIARDPAIPYWPAALNKKMAAAYCGLSTETFDKVCPVKPIRMTNSARGERYLRQRLDEWLLSIDPNGTGEGQKVSLADRLYNAPARKKFGDRLYGEPSTSKRRRRKKVDE